MQPNVTSNNVHQLLDSLEIELARLAARWRGTDDPQVAAELVDQYQRTLRAMLLLGYHQWLDMEFELPERYMPDDYVSGEFLKDTMERAQIVPFEPGIAAFASNMAHELLIPLTSIKGYTDLLAGGVVGELNEQQESFVRHISTNAERLENLLRDLLNVDRSRATLSSTPETMNDSENSS